MKLFKYLLIDDDVAKKFLMPLEPKEEPEYYLENAKQNRIYTYKEDPQIAFMSFLYHNVIVTRGHDDKQYNPVWAYVIIDNDEAIRRVIRNHKNWSTDKDSSQKKIKSQTTIKHIDTNDGVKYEITPMYLKLSGHLGAGNVGKRAYTLHEKILEEKQVVKIRHKEFPSRVDKEGNKVGRKIYVYWSNGEVIADRIHHKGHTFDNRERYLTALEKKAHTTVHDWEAKNNILRPGKIDFLRTEGINFSGSYNKLMICDCDDHICSECSAVLKIESEKEFMEFMEQLHSDEYRKLEGRTVYYDALKQVKK